MRLLVEKLLVAATSSALRSRSNGRAGRSAWFLLGGFVALVAVVVIRSRWWWVLFLWDILDIIFLPARPPAFVAKTLIGFQFCPHRSVESPPETQSIRPPVSEFIVIIFDTNRRSRSTRSTRVGAHQHGR